MQIQLPDEIINKIFSYMSSPTSIVMRKVIKSYEEDRDLLLGFGSELDTFKFFHFTYTRINYNIKDLNGNYRKCLNHNYRKDMDGNDGNIYMYTKSRGMRERKDRENNSLRN